jgi:hypothetical protein
MKICYQPKNFGTKRLAQIAAANTIIKEYQAAGYTLTVRQLYYQFVSRDLIPNKQAEYKVLADIISEARLAGLIDWEAIEDRTRNVRSLSVWDNPGQIVSACATQFKMDLWANQKYAPEVWIEKDALIGVIEGPCIRWRVPYFACRGYSSQSEQWRAGQRFREAIEQGRKPIVFHLGDHDPSGIDMSRDNQERLSLFAGDEIEVVRLALNMDQVRQYNPPPNPAKSTDTRFSNYQSLHGDSSWELDALEPSVIDKLVASNIRSILNNTQWYKDIAKENKAKETLQKIAVDLEGENDADE